MTNSKLRREDLVYPELCFKIVGVLFEVYNELGYGHSEKVYQKAVAIALKNAGLKFTEQKYYPLMFQGEKIGSGYFDFIVEEIIVLELKKGDRFVKAHIDQVNEYLVSNKLKLGILVYFAPRNLHYKRIVNIEGEANS